MTSKTLTPDIASARSKAAKFYKIDLHVHSYESHDFPSLGDKENGALELTEADHNAQDHHIIESAKAKDLRMMAITDHNRSRAAVELSKLSDDSLLVLPGMEVTLQTTIFPDSKVHVLTIFPQGCSSEDIERIFPVDCGMPRYDERTKDSVAHMSVDQLIEAVENVGGISIASHVNSNKGMRALFRDSNIKLLQKTMRRAELLRLKRRGVLIPSEEKQLTQLDSQIKELEDETQNRYLLFLSTHKFHAVEVQKSGEHQFYAGIHTDGLGIRPIACLLGSDAHNLQDIGLPGATTYVKMTTPSLVDLRRALLDPGARIRYEDTIERPQIPRILGIQFNGGFFQNHTLGFSDNLTCLIGGRGTGKSATIEALRYIFEHNLKHLDSEKRRDIERRREHTIRNSLVKVLFADTNGDILILQRNYADERTICYDTNGDRQESINVSVSSNIDVKIYGWGEIEELARNKREQLRLVDGFIPNIENFRSDIVSSIRKLEKNTIEIISLVKEVQQLLPQIGELPAKETALARLSSTELDAIFTDFDRNESASSALRAFQSEVLNLRQIFVSDGDHPHSLTEKIGHSLATALSSLEHYEWKQEFADSIQSEGIKLHRRYQAFLEQVDNINRIITDRTNSLQIERYDIESRISKQSEEYEENTLQTLVNRRHRLTREVYALRATKKAIEDKQNDINQLLKRRVQEILPELQIKRQQLTDIRRKKIVEINQRLDQLSKVFKVSIDLRHQEEREEFRLALGAPEDGAAAGILKGVNQWYKKHNYAMLYSRHHSPHTFVQAILEPGDYSALRGNTVSEDGEAHEVITLERAQQVAQHLSPYLEPGSPCFDAQKLKRLLELEHLTTEDLPIISLDGKPIEELSPGQRCSTLIPIILLENNNPLIIDQPEDNLDNKLVFDLVVDILRGLKEQRQIIVATHNPNIPVSGDAEQVIVFEAPSRELCEVVYQGSIDDETIVGQIKTIMEGSEQAFRIRAEKYGYRLNSIR